MRKLLFILLAGIMIMPLMGVWEVGDVIPNNYSWTDSNGGTHSFYSLTNVGKVVVVFWGMTSCPASTLAAGDLANWYAGQSQNEVYVVCSQNWNNGLTYSEEVEDFYYDFGNGYVPFFSVVGGMEVLHYGGNNLQDMIEIMPDVISEFNMPIVNDPVADQNLEFGEQVSIDIYELFNCYSGPVNVSVANNSYPLSVEAGLSGYTLTLTGQETSGRSGITLCGSNTTGSIEYTFWVTVSNPDPLVSMTSIEIADTPSQGGVNGNQNPYSNSWTDLWWENFPNENTGYITKVFVSGNLSSDANPEEGSLWLESPNRTQVMIADNFSNGTEVISIEISAFNGLESHGHWTIYFLDAGGNGGHALLDGVFSLETQSTLPNENTALSYDGIDDYLWGEGIPYSTGDMTLEAWIYPESFEDYQEIIFGIDPELSSTIQFRLNPDGSIIYGENPEWTNVLSRAYSVVLHEWNHVAVTREEGFCKLYANGVELEEGYVSQGIVPTNLYIGGRATGMDRMFDGKIDNVRIWNVARSAEELQAGMQTELTGTEYGLVGAWEFNEGEGQTVTSITTGGYDLTLGQNIGIDDSDPQWINTEEPHEIPICAYFGCNTNYGDVPLEVYFWDRSSGNPSQWSWDFNGDGIEDSNEQNPQWVYQIPGEYSIMLTVSDGENTHTTIRESYMHVTGTAILPPENLQVSGDGLASWEAPSSGGFSEDFDDYNAGEYLVGQTNGAWRTWDGSVGGSTDALVTTEQASNGANSVLIEGQTDILHEIGVGGYTTGHYLISVDVFVDDNYGAYFNVLHLWGENSEWGAEVFLPLGDTGYLRAEGTEYYFNYSMEEWIEYSFDLDLDNDWAIFKMNGNEIHSWQWSLGCFSGNQGHNQLSAINFYANGGAGFTPRYFVDDVSISVLGSGVVPEIYNVYLDGMYLDSTGELSYQFNNLVSGTVHKAGLSAVYLQGESVQLEQMFTYGAVTGDKALEFNGINDHVFCGRDASLDLDESFTLEAWINPTGWGEYDQIGYGRILDKKRYKLFLVDDGSAVGYNDHSLCLGTHCDGQSYAVSTPENSIELGEWQHISATYNMSGETHIYINGVEQVLTGDLPVGAVVSSSDYDLFIGEADNYGRAFEGAIDEVRIWDRTLSQMEILSSMMQELSGTEEGLAGYWQFDEGSGQYTTDLTGNGNYGRLGLLAQADEDDPLWIDSDFPFTQLTADFLANPQIGTAPLIVQFEDISSGPITGWSWDFDNDGVIDSTDPDPEWTYAEAGVYSVSLTVSDAESNTATELKDNYITVTPAWSVNPPSFEYNGTIWGVVYHEEIMIDHTEGILGCFVGEECRGVASFEDGSVIDYTGIPQFGHVAFLPMLYSNETSGETVNFKYWDPYIGVYDLSETVEFTSDMILGNGMDPYAWHTTTSVTVSKDFVNGWNWFSLNVLGDDMSINTILSSLGDSGNLIKNQTHSATYYSGMGWFGSLMEMNNSCLYKLEANSSAELEVSGVPVNPAESPISLSVGWNWVSYIPQEAEETNYALGCLENGNIIKDQSHSATYYSGMGWYGSLMEMQPLSGYMLEMNEVEELIYPVPEVTLREAEEFSFEVEEAGWMLNPHDYEFNGVVNVQLTAETNFDASDYELAIFWGEDCRGIAQVLDYTEPFGGIFHSMMIYSNEEYGEQLDFRLYNRRTGEVTDLENSIRFEADIMVGDFIDPLPLTVYGDDQAIPVTRLVNCYPNPFNPETNISFELAEDSTVKLEMYNVKGQKIDQIICDNLNAGDHVLTWEASEQSSGIYFLKFTAGETKNTQKLILLK